MSDYRPICDTWLLARPKAKYYGAYPSGFLERARALLGVSYDDSLLHVCGGKVRDYPFRGMGPNDKTLDLDPALAPDFLMDAREIRAIYTVDGAQSTLTDVSPPCWQEGAMTLWPSVLCDPPYSALDAAKYAPGSDALPKPGELLKRCLAIVKPGGRVGFLDYAAPRPPKKGVRLVAMVGVIMGFGNKARIYSVYEKDGPNSDVERKRALEAVCGKKVKPAKTCLPLSACNTCGEVVKALNADGLAIHDYCEMPTW